MNPSAFQKKIWAYYSTHRRSFPWRDLITPYRVVVSEIMLQQTQAPRVVPKFDSFIKKFPDFETLANTSLSDVLKEWQGLGYNRRAQSLMRLAEEVVARGGLLPHTYEKLIDLPGIGPNTAGAIMAFAYSVGFPFVETNLRTVFIHFFFSHARKPITDKKILKLIETTLPKPPYTHTKNFGKGPRDWYYALMDYGVMLKQKHRDEQQKDPAQKSRRYRKQSTFKGSNRELRSHLLKSILKSKTSKTLEILVDEFITKNHIYRTRDNILKNITALQREGFITISKKSISIRK